MDEHEVHAKIDTIAEAIDGALASISDIETLLPVLGEIVGNLGKRAIWTEYLVHQCIAGLDSEAASEGLASLKIDFPLPGELAPHDE